MIEKRVNKHYELPIDLINTIKTSNVKSLKSETDKIIYFLKLGIEYETIINNDINTKKEIVRINNDVRFIKQLLIQLFVNKSFAKNRNIKDDNCYNDFIRKLYKKNFND